ncbi:MAG TPA: hypothetical protein DEG71_07210 [Clostridiales bacterium]|nr:hypothetical protein [Clostridiales bacterium]
MEKEDLVLKYIENKNTTPLYFHFNINESFSIFTLKYLIIKILDLSEEYESCSIENELETNSGKWRSVLDIWRHVIYYKPDINIFEVMRELFSIGNEYLVGHYCENIKRRVFKLDKNTTGCALFTGKVDEFGLYFSDWETIGEKENV